MRERERARLNRVKHRKDTISVHCWINRAKLRTSFQVCLSFSNRYIYTYIIIHRKLHIPTYLKFLTKRGAHSTKVYSDVFRLILFSSCHHPDNDRLHLNSLIKIQWTVKELMWISVKRCSTNKRKQIQHPYSDSSPTLQRLFQWAYF